MISKNTLTSSLLTSSMRQQASTGLSGLHRIKCPLTCKKDKKHQAFELIFICLEKSCSDGMKPICAQCLHENHGGHEIKLIKEIAEIADGFVQSEKSKKQVSVYWDQLSEQYHSLSKEIDGLVEYLNEFQRTLKKVHEGFFSKLNKEKDQFWELVQNTSEDILKERSMTEEELLDKIKTIIKSVKIDDLEKPKYRFNVLKEETVLIVMENYKSVEYLMQQAKKFVFSTLSTNQITESYGAAEFRITEGEDYLKITSLEQDNKNENDDFHTFEIEDEQTKQKLEKSDKKLKQDQKSEEEEEEEENDDYDDEFDLIEGGEQEEAKKEEKAKSKGDLEKSNKKEDIEQSLSELEKELESVKEIQGGKLTAQEIRLKYSQGQQKKESLPLKSTPYSLDQQQFRFKFDDLPEDTLERELSQAQEKLRKLRDNFENRNSVESFPYSSYSSRGGIGNSDNYLPKSAASSLPSQWTNPPDDFRPFLFSNNSTFSGLQQGNYPELMRKGNNQFGGDFTSQLQQQQQSAQISRQKKEFAFGTQYKHV